MDEGLKIVTYNIRHGTKANEIVQNVLKLAKLDVGIICLQEVRNNPFRPLILDQMIEALGSTWAVESMLSSTGFDFGLATLWDKSQVAAEKFECLTLPKLPKVRLYEKAYLKFYRRYEKVSSKDIRPDNRGALVSYFKFKGKLLRVINIHLDWLGGFRQRAKQLSYIKDFLKVRAGSDFEILCGDFNTLGYYRFARVRSKIQKLLGPEFFALPQKKPTTAHLQTLDHIFVKNLKLHNTEVINYRGSDHFPLLAEVTD